MEKASDSHTGPTTTVLSIFCLLIWGAQVAPLPWLLFESARFHGRVDRILASST
jgi:hypothetical protein